MPNQPLPLLPLLLENVPRALSQALAQEGVPYRFRSANTTAGRFVLFDSRRGPYPAIEERQIAVDVDQLRRPGENDPFEKLLDQRAGRHEWQVAGLTISEEIARVDRRAVRRKLLDRLRATIEAAGGLWLSLAAFPFPYRGALNFRIDYDRFDPHDFDTTLATIAGYEEATSHFVNGRAYEPHPAALDRLRGLDVGSHGYHHHTYLTEEENRRNIRRGIEVLQRSGIEPSGFVAPHGRFNPGLLAALEGLAIGHSSEFGLAYDELPFFPGTDVLQIPIHPVSLGIFLETLEATDSSRPWEVQKTIQAALNYFRQTARAKYRAGEPVFLYGHPTGRLGSFPQVLRAVFDTADGFGAVWKTTLTQFAAWWRTRAGVRLSVTQQDERYIVRAERLPAAYRMAVEYWRGRHVARMPLNGRTLQFAPSALAYENREPRPGLRPVRVDGPEGIRSRIRRWIDWEKETPVEEINKLNFRNWAKRTLRRLRA